MKKNDIKVGMKVKVVSCLPSTFWDVEEWDNMWVSGMDKYVGGVFTVKLIKYFGVKFEESLQDEENYSFPPMCLEPVGE